MLLTSNFLTFSFLAHLSTKCSGWAFVMAHCRPSSVRPSVRPCVRASTISLNNIFSKTYYWILTKLHRNHSWGSPIKVVQTVPVGCISRSQGKTIGFQNAIFKNLLFRNYKAQSFHIWYIASSKGPLPNLFKLCPWGLNWPCPSVTILHWII